MRNPRAWRTAALAFVASGIAAGAAPFLLPEPSAPDDSARRRIAAENRDLAERDDREALYHATMAVCLSTVGDREQARTERSRATVLRRTAQIKRDIARTYDPSEGGDAGARS